MSLISPAITVTKESNTFFHSKLYPSYFNYITVVNVEKDTKRWSTLPASVPSHTV